MARFLRSQGVSKLRPPAAVGASVTFRPVQVTRARTDYAHRGARPVLRPALYTFAVPVLPLPISIRLARARRAGLVTFELRQPVVVGASIVFSPVRTQIVRTPRQAVKSRSVLRPPVLAVVTTLLAPILVRLARVKRTPDTQTVLRQPTVVAPSIQFRPVQTRIVRTPAQAIKTQSRLRAPVLAVAALVAPITVRLARIKRTGRASSRLRPPTVQGASTVFRPVKTTQVRRPPQAGKSRNIGWRKVPGLADMLVFVSGFFDQPTVGNDIDAGTPSGTFMDDPSVHGMDSGDPDGDFFDPPNPRRG